MAMALVPAAMAVCLGTSCGTPPAELPHPKPATAEERGRPSVRTHRALCNGAPCTVRVELAGNREVPSDEIFSVMRVLEDPDFSLDTLERDVLMLSSLYYDRGYLTVAIADPTVEWSPRGSAVHVGVSIEEGVQYRIKRIDVYEDRSNLRCPPMGGWSSPLHPGNIFNRRQLVLDLSTLTRPYRDQGYAYVEALPRTSLDPERREVAITIPVIRGAVYSIARIRFEGNRLATDADLRKRIEVVEGARFSETALDRSKARLLETGLFERVDISIERREGSLGVDIRFEVSERFPPTATEPPSDFGSGTPTQVAQNPGSAASYAGTFDDPGDTRGCQAIPISVEIGARHILVMYAGSQDKSQGVKRTRNEARQRAQEVLQKIRAGGNFEELLRQYTDEPGGAERTGDLGVFGRDVMVETFSNAAFRLQVGEVSEVVETRFGFHIIQRTE